MKVTQKRGSLYAIVAMIVISVISVVMLLMLSYSYYTTKTKLQSQFDISSQKVLERLQISLAPFIASYSINEYENLIENEMENKNIYAIVVEDFLTGKIYGSNAYITGKTRDETWKIVEYSQEQVNKEDIYLIKETQIENGDVVLGKLKIYYSDKLLQEQLYELIVRTVFILLIVSVVLIVFLFVILRKKVVNPLEKVIEELQKRDQEGFPGQLHMQDTSKEILQLCETMNEMISKAKDSQQQIKALNERFSLTLEAVKDGIWDWDIQTDKTYYSKRWKSMLGYEESEIKNEGKEFFRLIHNEDKQKVQDTIEKHFKDPVHHQYNLEIRLLCKDGSYKWILSRGKAILDQNGDPVRMLGYHSDITQEKENEEHLKQQEKIMSEQAKMVSMGEMIGNIAHQWRQPLSVISAGATGLKLSKEFDTLSEEQFFDICDSINDNAQYLSKTIDDFRDFAKGERKLVDFYLDENINSFLHLVEGAVKTNDIHIVLQIPSKITIKSYPNELIQCFINIFNNSKDALKQIKEKRLFFITATIQNKQVVIKFQDNAGGIPDDVLPHIFEPYFTTKHKSQGTGLGLSMTYNLIVKGMKGNIEASNIEYTYENQSCKGAVLTITLPLSA